MCKAKEYTEQLLNIYNKINSDFENYSQELSQTDLYEQDVLHIIEAGGFNAAEGYNLAKMICDNRQKRRQIKNELEPLKQLKNNFIDNNMKSLSDTYQTVVRKDAILTSLTENKRYNPRVLNTTNIKQISSQQLINRRAVYIKTGEEVTIIRADSDGLYYVKRKNGVKNYIKSKELKIS